MFTSNPWVRYSHAKFRVTSLAIFIRVSSSISNTVGWLSTAAAFLSVSKLLAMPSPSILQHALYHSPLINQTSSCGQLGVHWYKTYRHRGNNIKTRRFIVCTRYGYPWRSRSCGHLKVEAPSLETPRPPSLEILALLIRRYQALDQYPCLQSSTPCGVQWPRRNFSAYVPF